MNHVEVNAKTERKQSGDKKASRVEERQLSGDTGDRLLQFQRALERTQRLDERTKKTVSCPNSQLFNYYILNRKQVSNGNSFSWVNLTGQACQ